MTKMINRMEGVGVLGSLQFKLWWWHPGQGEAVQEEKVEVIIIIIVLFIIFIILFAKDGDADDNLYNWSPIIGNPFRCEGVGREGRVCNTFSCSGNHHVRLLLVIYNPRVRLFLVIYNPRVRLFLVIYNQFYFSICPTSDNNQGLPPSLCPTLYALSSVLQLLTKGNLRGTKGWL